MTELAPTEREALSMAGLQALVDQLQPPPRAPLVVMIGGVRYRVVAVALWHRVDLPTGSRGKWESSLGREYYELQLQVEG
jgi:hypothetical protein